MVKHREDWGNVSLSGVFGLLAGFINVLALKSLGVTVSHVTGTVTKVGIDILDFEMRLVFVGAGLWIGYVFGAAIGQILYEKIGTIAPLFIEGTFLVVVGLCITDRFLIEHEILADFIAFFTAGGMGMQNIVTSGTSMSKTTHLTGASTEFGIAIAKRDRKKFEHMGFIIGGFLFGALIAFAAEFFIGIKGFIIPGIVIIIIAVYNMDKSFFLRKIRKEGSHIYGVVSYEDAFGSSVTPHLTVDEVKKT